MANEVEKMFGAEIPISIIEEFDRNVDALSSKKKLCLEAAIKLWISLPIEAQQRLLNKKMSETAFIELVRQIVDERFEAGRKAGQELLERQKHKPSQKD